MLLLGFIAGAATRAQGPASGETELRHIHGVVVDSVTSRPIGRALVVSQDQRLAMMTDSEGRFGFDFRAPAQAARPSASSVLVNEAQVQSFYQGLVALVARKPGYLPMTDAGLVSLNDRKADDAELRLTLMPEAIIAGYVTASGTDASRDVTVTLMHRQVQDGSAVWVPMQSRQTNGRGEFRFAELPAGAYRVMTQEWMENGVALPAAGHTLMGYPPARYPETSAGIDGGAFEVAAGTTVQANLDLRAAPYHRVEIAIAGAAGAPGYGVEVQTADGRAGYSLGFNARTHRVEGFLPDGSYRVLLEGYGPEPEMTEATITVAGRPVVTSMTLAPRQSTPVVVREEFTAVAARDAGAGSDARVSLQGRQQGVPVDVMLRSAEDGAITPMQNGSGRDGRGMRIEGTWPGRYRVLVRPSRGYAAAVTAGGDDLLRTDLVIGQSGVGAPIEITLRDDGATLTGTLTGLTAAGRTGPVTQWPELLCVSTGSDTTNVTAVSVGADGRFEVPNLAPGTYRLIAFSHRVDGLEYRNAEAMRRFDTKGVLVTVAAGQKAQIEVPVIAREDE